MTESQPPSMSHGLPPIGTDPITAILLAVTRIEGAVQNALKTLERHDETITKHGDQLEDHGTRLTAIETRMTGDAYHEDRRVSAKAVFWSGVAAIAIVLSLVIPYMVHHG